MTAMSMLLATTMLTTTTISIATTLSPIDVVDGRSTSNVVFPNVGVAYSNGVNLTYTVNNFTRGSSGSWDLNTDDIRASISQRDGGFFDLEFTSKHNDVSRVSFPMLQGTMMDTLPDMFAMFPLLGGVFVKNGGNCYGECFDDFVMEYPGGFHAPYVCLATTERALLAAATTWPPHHLHPKRRVVLNNTHENQPLQIDWVNGYAAGTTVNMSILLTEFASNGGDNATEAWQLAVLAYRAWLTPHLPTPVQPTSMVLSEGMLAIGLQNMMAFNLTNIDRMFREWQDVLPRVQFWGQMSNYAGPPAMAHPPLRPGEVVGCCVLNKSMHPRYLNDCDVTIGGGVNGGGGGGVDKLNAVHDGGGGGGGDGNGSKWKPGSRCLPAWANHLATTGYEVGYYVRKGNGDLLTNLTWFDRWLSDMAALGGNAQYVDTYARTFNGDPARVLAQITAGVPPANVITEGWNDVYPFAGLLSGYHQGYDWCNCSRNTTIYDMHPFGATPGGSFIKMVRLLMGDAIGFFGYQDGEYARYGAAHNYFSERQAFMLGAKLDAGLSSDFIRVIARVRGDVSWWKRGFKYMDTVGVINTHVGLIDVRRFDDITGTVVLAIDNWRNVSGLTVSFGGKQFEVASNTISVIETTTTTTPPPTIRG